jgi:Transposase IS116/IS110/IS902 family
VAVAALRSPGRQEVRSDDHAVVLRVWSRRHRQLSRLRTQAACRLHAVLCEITPGGVPQVITANRAVAILAAHAPDGPVAATWHELAAEHLADLRRLDAQRREIRKKLTTAVRASGTTVTEVFGVGPVIAAAIIGDAGDAARFPTADRFASCNGTAPIEVSSGRRKPGSSGETGEESMVMRRPSGDHRGTSWIPGPASTSRLLPWPGTPRPQGAFSRSLRLLGSLLCSVTMTPWSLTGLFQRDGAGKASPAATALIPLTAPLRVRAVRNMAEPAVTICRRATRKLSARSAPRLTAATFRAQHQRPRRSRDRPALGGSVHVTYAQ